MQLFQHVFLQSARNPSQKVALFEPNLCQCVQRRSHTSVWKCVWCSSLLLFWSDKYDKQAATCPKVLFNCLLRWERWIKHNLLDAHLFLMMLSSQSILLNAELEWTDTAQISFTERDQLYMSEYNSRYFFPACKKCKWKRRSNVRSPFVNCVFA